MFVQGQKHNGPVEFVKEYRESGTVHSLHASQFFLFDHSLHLISLRLFFFLTWHRLQSGKAARVVFVRLLLACQ